MKASILDPGYIWCCGCEKDREAIVRYCAQLCDELGDNSPDDYEAGGAYGCRSAILHAFGLK